MVKKKQMGIKIDIDVDWMADLFEKYLKKGDLNGFHEEFLGQMHARGLGFLKKNAEQLAKSVADDYSQDQGYNNVVGEIWLEGFLMLRMLLGVSVSFADHFRGLKLSHDYRRDLREVLIALHVKACLTTNEVICLMENGFPNGAYSHWRSLYEISTISAFLQKYYSPELVQRYIDHGTWEVTRAFEAYERTFERLGFDPPTKAEMKQNGRVKSRLQKKYAKDFFKPYGWAAEELKKQKLGLDFRGIEDATDLSHWRPFYKHSSQGVHAGAQGLYSQLGVEDADNILLIGKSYKHMLDPAQATVISLGQLTANLLLCAHKGDPLEQVHLPYLVSIVNILTDKTKNAFVEIDRKLTKNGKRLASVSVKTGPKSGESP